jgi:hypothetical protein
MSIARAFTVRRDKADSDSMFNLHLSRATSQRGAKPVLRSNISSPLALISTTNMISYNAPDIAGTAPISVRLAPSRSSSSSGDDDSDRSVKSGQTVTDMSSLETSPISSQPEENHLSCYFKPPTDSTPVASSFAAAPSLPTRVPSHSKRAHEHIHRKRTIQRMLSPPPSTSHALSPTSEESGSTAKESTFVSAPRENPFHSELRELDEVAQGYSLGHVAAASISTRKPEDSPEASYLASRGLVHLSASDYLAEIQGLIYAHLADDVPAWI